MPPDQEQDLIRAIANRLRDATELQHLVPDEHAALQLIHQVHHRCHCGAPTTLHGRHVRCPHGHQHTLASATFKHTKLPLRLWLTAIWHLHVDDASIAARVFGRRYGVDKMTAWRLLKRVRAAFILYAAPAPTSRSQTMGHKAASNIAFCLASIDDDGLLTLLDERSARHLSLPAGRPHPVAAMVVGYLQCWLATVFRGVRAHYQNEYLAEFADRQRRLAITPKSRWTALARDVRHSRRDGRS